MELTHLWLIQLAPLAAFFLIFLLPRNLKKIAPFVGILASFLAMAASICLLDIHFGHEAFNIEFSKTWLAVSTQSLWQGLPAYNYSLSVGFLLDPLNLVMISIVTIISFFVQLFSFYYMKEDPSRPRYFAFLSFFSFTMTGLVLSNNLLQTFIFWELVGLASYLLIGFWYEKNEAATAARKAFVMNRLADLGFYLGILLLFIGIGTLNFSAMTPENIRALLPQEWLFWVPVLVFMGVMGKSAQFPFHNWLPDAMEGPTPVSALLHSATMVAAGVFLLARAFGLFSVSVDVLTVILIFGSLTALVGAFLATIQKDIKKILAYSTISQLGLMVMAVGAGSQVAAMFHLSTHAFFKSLLFLTAGAFIHTFHTNDIDKIAKSNGRKQHFLMAALMLGLFSLSGIFPFAGFFSKDLILETLEHRSIIFYGIGLLVSFITAYYSFRLLFVLLRMPAKPHHDDHAHHESLLVRFSKAAPLVILALLSLYVGALGTTPFHSKLLVFLGGEHAHFSVKLFIITSIMVLVAAVIAFMRFQNPEATLQKESGNGAVVSVLRNKFFIDDIYVFLVKKVGLGFAGLLDKFEKAFIKGVMVDFTSYRVLDLGKMLALIQNGKLQDYLATALAVALIVLYFTFFK